MSKLSRNIERQRQPYYKAAKGDVMRALKADRMDLMERIRKCTTPEQINFEASKQIRKDNVDKAITKVYQRTGAYFGQQTFKNLTGTKSVKRLANYQAGNVVASEDYWFAYMEKFVNQRLGNRIVWITNTTEDVFKTVCQNVTAEGIQAGLSMAEMAAKIQTELGITEQYRAQRIAQTEVVGASNEGSHAGASATGLDLVKEWMTSGLASVRETHAEMEGVTVGIDETFQVPTLDGTIDEMQYPGDPSGSAGNVINCHCTIGYNGAEGTSLEWGRNL